MPASATLVPLSTATIRSTSNPTFRRLTDLLTSSRRRREEGVAVLEGAHLLSAWMQRYGSAVEALFFPEGATAIPSLATLLGQVVAQQIVVCDERLFRKASPVGGENAVLAIVHIPAVVSPGPRAPGCFEVWLDHVQDPGNVGTLIRSAAAAGATTVRLGHGCADAWSPKCLRAGMGGHFIIEIEERSQLLERAADPSIRLLAADGRAEASVFDVDLTGTVALLLGGEGDGLSPELGARVSRAVRIPMAGAVESLNVAAAGAIICFERLRQVMAAASRAAMSDRSPTP